MKLKHFLNTGEKIQYCNSEHKESLFVFSPKFSVADIADTIRSNDKIPVAALELRKAPLTLALQLNDRFCNAQEFENAWKNTIIPHTVMFY